MNIAVRKSVGSNPTGVTLLLVSFFRIKECTHTLLMSHKYIPQDRLLQFRPESLFCWSHFFGGGFAPARLDSGDSLPKNRISLASLPCQCKSVRNKRRTQVGQSALRRWFSIGLDSLLVVLGFDGWYVVCIHAGVYGRPQRGSVRSLSWHPFTLARAGRLWWTSRLSRCLNPTVHSLTTVPLVGMRASSPRSCAPSRTTVRRRVFASGWCGWMPT